MSSFNSDPSTFNPSPQRVDPIPSFAPIASSPNPTEQNLTPFDAQSAQSDNTLTPASPPIAQNLTDFDTQSAQLNTSDPTLTPRQHAAIALLLAGHTITAAAALLKITRATLHNWKNKPHFQAELTRRQIEVTLAANNRLRLTMLQAAQSALDSLHTRHHDDRFQHAFRLLAILRHYIPIMDKPDPPMPADSAPGSESSSSGG